MNKCEILKNQRDLLAKELVERTGLGIDGFKCCGDIIDLVPFEKRFDRPSCLDCESNGGCTAVKGKIIELIDGEIGYQVFVEGA